MILVLIIPDFGREHLHETFSGARKQCEPSIFHVPKTGSGWQVTGVPMGLSEEQQARLARAFGNLGIL